VYGDIFFSHADETQTAKDAQYRCIRFIEQYPDATWQPKDSCRIESFLFDAESALLKIQLSVSVTGV
jgi:hypothetical protein